MQHIDNFRSLPKDEQQKLNSFYHNYFNDKQKELWKSEGDNKINMFRQFTSMLLCAEDLGMVPSMVESMLQEKQILCLRVERMPVNNDPFFSPSKAPYLSVVTPSTHDMSPLREWWTEADAPVQFFYNYQLALEGIAPEEMSPGIARQIIQQHIDSPAMWSVFLLQDVLAMNETVRKNDFQKERINNPSDRDHVWNYRMHMTIEKLAEEREFIKTLKSMIKKSGR